MLAAGSAGANMTVAEAALYVDIVHVSRAAADNVHATHRSRNNALVRNLLRFCNCLPVAKNLHLL